MGRSFWSTSTSPTCVWARNSSDFPWTVEDVPTVPLHVAWGRDTWAVSSFAAIPQQLWRVRVWRQVHAGGHCGRFSCWNLRCFTGGVVATGWRSLCLGFRSSSRTRDGLPQGPAVAVVPMSVEPFDSATALSKEASDENLWKLKPTPSRRKLRVFVRTGSHTSCVRRST